jgi:hypothetical protein
VAAWPAEEVEHRASEIAYAAEVLLRRPGAWRHRRVETITLVTHEAVRRQVSIDFTVPEEYRASLRLSESGEYAVPLAVLAKRPLIHFDLRNEEGHSIPLLTAEQSRMIGRELLYVALDADLAAQDADAEAVVMAAGPIIDTVLDESVQLVDDRIDEIEAEFGLESLTDFRTRADTLGRGFIMWAVVRGLERRRIFKYAHDEGFAQRPALAHVYDARGCTEATTFHVEVAVPPGLRARTTTLVDDATGAVLAAGARDADRPAIYFAADPARGLGRPALVVAYGAERWRFLGPAALVAAVIMLLVAPPLFFADLQALSGSAGAAIGLVLSTSAVFSALLLRTDEHPLLRVMLVRYRLWLVACALAALFAAAALGFRARPWVLETTWGLAAAVSALATGILVVEAVRAPSLRRRPPPSP